MDHFHLTPGDIGELTDWQIEELYFHVRDNDGRIREPVGLPDEKVMQGGTLLTELMQIDYLASGMRLPQDEVKRLKDEVRAKWQVRTS